MKPFSTSANLPTTPQPISTRSASCGSGPASDKEPLLLFIQQHVPANRHTLETIADQFDRRTVAKNETVLRAGAVSNEYLFLSEGFMRAFTPDPNGNEVTTFFYAPIRPVFEVSSFFMRVPSAETIYALTDCVVYGTSFDKVNSLFHTVPEFREFGRMMLVKAFAAFKQRTLSLINQSAEARYAELMATDRELFQHAQLKHIASYLGITDTSLSRIRREYAKKGLTR